MTAVLAAVRPDETHFPLFVHVLGAMILVGGLVTAAALLVFARGDIPSLRRGYWTLLAVALPGWFVMRVGAEWIYQKEHWDDLPDSAQPTWLGIGYMLADLGGLLLLVSLIVGGIGMRRLKNGGGTGLLRATMILSLVILAAYVVAVWAMAGKPD
jgi:hypothetical protein